MPTKAGIAAAAFGIVALAAGRVFGIFELYMVAAAGLALVACAWLWVIVNRRSLEVRRSVSPDRLHAGNASTVTLSLSNNRLLRSPVAQITDQVEGEVRADAHVPPLRRHSTTRASYRVPTTKRGRVEIGPMRTRVTDPFGMAATTRTSAPDASLLVLPRIDDIAPPPQPGGKIAQQMDRTPNRVGPSGDEFSSLRSYVLGDDLRKVHWPSSARVGELVVRNEHIPEHGHSLVLLDVRSHVADADTFEQMVSAAASIVVACRERGDRVRFVTTAGVDHTADTAVGCDAILDLLALVEQSRSTTVSLPFVIGQSGAEAGALVVASDADALVTAMHSSTSSARGTYVVRFRDAQATPADLKRRLPSSRMVDVPPGQDFASVWSLALRP